MSPILTFLDSSLQFMVEVGASEKGVGAILPQSSPKKNKLHPCFLFFQLTAVTMNYWQSSSLSGSGDTGLEVGNPFLV